MTHEENPEEAYRLRLLQALGPTTLPTLRALEARLEQEAKRLVQTARETRRREAAAVRQVIAALTGRTK